MSRPAFSILLVCTGNICRSAMGERLGRAYLEEVLGDEARQIRLTSAGTQAVVDSAMHPDSALVLRGLGGDPTGYVARQLTDGMVMGADLVLTMTRDHRRDVLGLAPRALSRTFTLLEAADLVRLLGDEDLPLPGETLPDRARALVTAMATARSRRESGANDIADPMGRPLEAHQEAGDGIVDSLLPVLSRIASLRDEQVPG